MVDEKLKRLMEIRDMAEKTKNVAEELIAELGGKEPSDWAKQRIELICRIFNKGSVMEWDAIKDIWTNEMGKDVRGVAAYTRDDAKILAKMADGKFALTKYASDLVKDETGLSLEEYAKKFK